MTKGECGWYCHWALVISQWSLPRNDADGRLRKTQVPERPSAFRPCTRNPYRWPKRCPGNCASAEKAGVPAIRRHIFLCCDQTKPNCSTAGAVAGGLGIPEDPGSTSWD